MAKQTINLGTGELTGDGESIRSAFDKINDNFDELYAKDATDFDPGSVSESLIPDTDVAYDLGSADKRFRDLYLSGSTIDLGGTTLSVAGGELQLGGVKVPTTADVAATVASAVSAPTGDLTGSVFADDSTLLVDGVAGKIRGEIENTVVNIVATDTDVNIIAADDIDLETTSANGNIRLNSADGISLTSAARLNIQAGTGIDIYSTDNIYATVTNDIDFISDTGTARLEANGRVDLISNTGQFNIEGTNGSISVETDLIIFTNALTENNPTGTNNNIQLLQNGNIRAEAFQGDIYNDSGDTKLLDASQEELLCDVAFTPDAAGGWDTFWADPKPQTVAEALDRLAQAIYIANGGTPV